MVRMICIWGRMGSGKSFLADKIKYACPEYNILSSSKFLKEEFDLLINKNGECSYPIAEKILSKDIKSYKTCVKENDEKGVGFYKRKILQLYGTEITNLFGYKEIWSKKLSDYIMKNKIEFVINDGCRFPFELDVFAEYCFDIYNIHVAVNKKVVRDVFIDRYGLGYFILPESKSIINHYSDMAFDGWIKDFRIDKMLKHNGKFSEDQISNTIYLADKFSKRSK